MWGRDNLPKSHGIPNGLALDEQHLSARQCRRRLRHQLVHHARLLAHLTPTIPVDQIVQQRSNHRLQPPNLEAPFCTTSC
eukprot:1543147-Pleurochrysis_carterae.AAC.1